MIDPRRLLELLRVAKCGSLTKAAASLRISQPALSKSIATLERAVGVPLVHRSRRGSSLTNAGQLLVFHAHALDVLLRRAEDEVNQNKAGLGGTLSLGVSPVGSAWLAPAVGAFKQEAPNVSVQIFERADDELMLQLQSGEIDAVISPGGAFADPPGVVSKTLTEDRFAVFVNRSDPLSKRRSVSLRELRHHTWVVPDRHTAIYRQIEALFAAAGEPFPSAAVLTNSITALKAMIIRNSFVAIASSVLMNPELDAGYICGIALEEAKFTRKIVVRTRELNAEPTTRRFVECLCAEAAPRSRNVSDTRSRRRRS